jgi:hypothetical protein
MEKHMAKQPSSAQPKPRRSKEAAEAPPPDALGVQPGIQGHAPTEDDIRRRAYERYLERGGHHGTDFEDWLHAEQELKSGGSRASNRKSEG